MIKYLLLLVAASSTYAKIPIRFDGFQVHRITPQTVEQLEALLKLQQTPNGFDFWTDTSTVGQPVDVMVAPHLKYDFEDLVELQQLNSSLMIKNVQELIEMENLSNGRSGDFGWDDYHTLDEIHDWLRSLPSLYPGIVSLIVGGRSFEGREILGVKISFKSGNKGVFLEGGMHAREWISPATVTYIANQLLSSNDSAVRAVAESRDWYVFPSTNPDGYVYSRINRLWRKTRQPYDVCYGADPNRNWDYHWMDGGASNNSCSETFAGSAAFSEPETKSVSEYFSTIAENLNTFIGFHSYGQILLIPFGHNGLEVPANNDELLKIGKNAVEVLAARYGTQYTVGNVPEAISGLGSGASFDWVAGTYRHIRLVFEFELRDTGRHGFLLPREQILPTGEETLDAVVSIIQQADADQ